MRCPCGSGETLDNCCGPLHSGAKRAATAEQLMRSRFAAFAVGDVDYLLSTWHRQTRPDDLELDPDVTWTRLEVVASRAGGILDQAGTVEFRAFYRNAGSREVMHEVSEFVRVDGAWVYVSPQRHAH